MSFNIISATKNITEKYIRYLKTMFDIDDPEYRKLFINQLSNLATFSKGPYLDVVDSFKSGATVKQLISDGKLNKDFETIPSIYEKILYKHQEKALNILSAGRNVVVSTGTGSGKTESFLIPILNDLMNERAQKGTLTPGVRALLIYPMNALANDQISRLRSLLKDYPYITYGSYTGQTEETYTAAEAKYAELNNGEKPLKNELISREQMKEKPPHILITNYSMLEYLMLRPKDNSLFQGIYSHNWRFVVLDEAHTYSGSTGIEVSMLLRRLNGFLYNSKISYILTSATLGSEGSDADVAKFASNLCNAPFSAEDVIRASRINLSFDNNNSITITAEDYCELADILDSGNSNNIAFEMIKAYLSLNITADDYPEYLFDALIKDRTFWMIKEYLKTPKTVKELCSYMNWTEKQISSFVDVASAANKNRKKLFDSRYHMFLRATEGVFVTLGKYKDLSLTRQTTKHTENGDYKFFEIVTCSQCHAIYLIGSIEKEGKYSYLKQKSNIGGNAIKEAFLIGDVISDEDDDNRLEDEHLEIQNYELCPHCGFIRESNLVHKEKCAHNESEYISLIKVKQSERTGRVTKCVKCEGTNNMGILRSFFSGQEASTSVIGTALFEELPSVEHHVEERSSQEDPDDYGFSDDIIDEAEEYNIKKEAKQFIAFSDNRQAAAFYATYFSDTYRSFLYSRIVNKHIKQLDIESGVSIPKFVKSITPDFKENEIADMYDSDPDYAKEAWKAIMKELIESYSRNSLIGLGLMKIGFIDSIQIPSNKKWNLTSREVSDICLVLISSMLVDNAISHKQNFTDYDIAFYSNNGSEKDYVLSDGEKYMRTFISRNDSRTNKRMDYLFRVLTAKGLDADREGIIILMNGIWKRLNAKDEKKGILTEGSEYPGKRVSIDKLSVINTDKWYCCSKCKRITAYNVADVCPAYRCDGKLEPIIINEVEKTNHYYRIYNDLEIRPLRVVEHTAQLENKEAYKLQDKFIRQEIDVLSCSTTFEMGVDIGDLETVFMRNMPPTPSNYTQRAGRAGRSSRSAALALTFCNKSNHDFSFFNDPVSMINGEIQPPLFKVENEKIGIRHLYSAAFAAFWKENPDYFGCVKDLFGEKYPNGGYDFFEDYINKRPEELKEYLLRVFPNELIKKFEINSFGWTKWLFDQPNNTYPNLKTVYERYRGELDSLYKAKVEAENNTQFNSMYIRRINTITNENLITFLSRNNILPKYGFPVDTVELQVATNKYNSSLPIELSRDLAMAISEYAPGCEVVASGNLIKSRYIRTIPNKAWRMYDYISCKKCQTLNIWMHTDIPNNDLKRCKHCDETLDHVKKRTFLIPEFGFVSDNKVKKPSLIKPDRTYRTEATMVSSGNQTLNGHFIIGSVCVDVTAMEDGEIAVLNKTDFFVCSACGYAISDIEAKDYKNSISKSHVRASGYKCKSTHLKKYSLGYWFKTDALRISIDGFYSYDEAYSILQAIILSACNVLNLDNNEISGCIQFVRKNLQDSYDFVIYDTTPGGAGHVRRICTKDIMKKILTGAYLKAKNCDCGGEDADSSCYKCLRTYRNQQHHDELKRIYVIEGLSGVTEQQSEDEGDAEMTAFTRYSAQTQKKITLITETADNTVSDLSFEEIFDDICGEKKELARQVTQSMIAENAPKPDYSWIEFEDYNGNKYSADLVWTKKKVMAFHANSIDDFNAAVNSDYKCFIFDENLDVDKFVNSVK